jgi:uncharacterized protein YjdB
MTATPAQHYDLAIWRINYPSGGYTDINGSVDKTTGVATLNFNMPSVSVNVEAIFVVKEYEITLGTGLTAWYMKSGVKTTVASGDKLVCGTAITVEAAPGIVVSNWTVIPSTATQVAGGQSCTYAVEDNASFAVDGGIHYLLTIDPVTNGTVKVTIGTTPSSANFATGVLIQQGTKVTIRVVPNDSATHAAGTWTVNGTSAFYMDDEIEITINGATTVSHTLISLTPNPVISFDNTVMGCVNDSGAPVNSGDAVSAGTGLTFTVLSLPENKCVISWSVGPNATVSNVMQTGGDSFAYTMPSANSYVCVFIEDITFSVTVVNGSNGTHVLDCGPGVVPTAVPFGGNVHLQVTPDSNYRPEVALSGGPSGSTALTPLGSAGGVFEYEVDNLRYNATLTIRYIDTRDYTVTNDKAGLIGGEFSASASTAKEGETVSLSAMAGTGYYHASWIVTTAAGAPVQVMGGQFIMPAANVVVKATFDPISSVRYDLTVVNGMDCTNLGPYAAGTYVILLAAPAPAGKEFDKWISNSGAFFDAGNSMTILFMPAGNATVTATYKAASSGGGTPPSVVSVTGITLLEKMGLSVKAGEGLQLSATITPLNASNKNISWSSSNPFVASVDSTGLVSAHKEGKVTITVMTHESGYFETCEITILSDGSSTTGSDGGDNSLLMWTVMAAAAAFGFGIACTAAVFILKAHR